MNPRRLRAPSSDGALLAEPPLSEAPGRLVANDERLDVWDYDFQGRRADRLRPLVRSQVLERAKDFARRHGLDYPDLAGDESTRLAVTGHQPELFHPGVWVKNFATASVARSAGALGLNLIVDNDTPKSSEIRVPFRVGDQLAVQRVAFDEWQGERPYEDILVADEASFATFGGRVRSRLGGLVDDPLIDDFWPRAVAARGVTGHLGTRFAVARRSLEASWGVRNLEVPLSAVCETQGFYWFATHVLAQLPRFQRVHNDSLNEYRSLHGIRSKHHPVPSLTRQGEWLEAPFWVWRADQTRRRPLLARQLARTMELRIAGEGEAFAELPLAPDREGCCAVERLAELPDQRIRLRTRALTTTMFARLLLGDLFVHGIGGAKYDELGDEIVRRFFGFEPPSYLTLSMTLWLGLDHDAGAAERLHAVSRTLRDLTFNPDRHLGASVGPEVLRLVEAKRAAVSAPVDTHRERVNRFRAIRLCNESLRELVSDLRAEAEAEHGRLLGVRRRNAVARSREYALVLHSRRRLCEALTRAVPGGLELPVC